MAAKDRPVNSLIDEILDFKKNTKATAQQTVTKEYTADLEKLIKQRILDEAFDDRVKYNFDLNI